MRMIVLTFVIALAEESVKDRKNVWQIKGTKIKVSNWQYVRYPGATTGGAHHKYRDLLLSGLSL